MPHAVLLTCMCAATKALQSRVHCVMHYVWHWLAGSLRALACWADSDTPPLLAALPTASPLQSVRCLDKKIHYILSSRLRADQMPGPPREGQLMCTATSGLIRCLVPHGRAS